MSASRWEFKNQKQMLSFLIGQDFGANPEEKFAEIVRHKQDIAKKISSWLKLKKTDRVLEIGSGIGAMSAEIAPRVQQLYCCDVSRNFLQVAENACAGIENVSFHHVENAQLAFLEDRSLDAVFSFNVFIHFNLFDIYWYLCELSRVVKPGGQVWFDIAMAEDLKNNLPPLFTEMTNLYRKDQKNISVLVQWNSAHAVATLAEHFGFKVKQGGNGDSAFLLVR